MARIARLVAPGLPHYVTQRGNRRMTVFFGDEDYRLYLDIPAERCRKERNMCGRAGFQQRGLRKR